jgi:hypothetical protein
VRAAVNALLGVTAGDPTNAVVGTATGCDAIFILMGASETAFFYFREDGNNLDQVDAGELSLLGTIDTAGFTLLNFTGSFGMYPI